MCFHNMIFCFVVKYDIQKIEGQDYSKAIAIDKSLRLRRLLVFRFSLFLSVHEKE